MLSLVAYEFDEIVEHKCKARRTDHTPRSFGTYLIVCYYISDTTAHVFHLDTIK